MGDALASRRVSPSEVVAESLARIELASDLNAVVSLAPEALIRHDLDRAISTPGMPLAAAPLLVKDVEDVAGMRTSFGSLIHALDPPAEADGLVAQRLRALGAVVVGKTNTPEFAMEGYTANRLFGATLNPWNVAHSPGGSSGGSAASLAAGLAIIATATDGGGSGRIPAAMCGLVCLKPTAGHIGHAPARLPIDLSTTAPIASTVGDVERLTGHLLGRVHGDPMSFDVALNLGDGPPPVRLCATERLAGSDPVPGSVSTAFWQAVEEVERVAGLSAIRVASGCILPAEVDLDWATVYSAEDAHAAGFGVLRSRKADLEAGIVAWVELGLNSTIEEYLDARLRRLEYVRRLDAMLGDDTVLLCPTTLTEGYPPDGHLPDRDGPGLPMGLFNTAALNFTGHPAITVPAGMLPSGLPFGLQLIAPRGFDRWLLDLAASCERAWLWPLTAPGFTPLAF